jgi:hypothetical protein
MAEEEKKITELSKQRGAGFPVLSLPEAVKIIKEAGKYGKQHALAAVAGYAGHQSHTSGPFKQKLAALREWGLVTTASGTATLTESAMRIAHPSSDEDVVNALLDAFRSSPIFLRTYEDAAKGIALKLDVLGNSAVTRLGVSATAKAAFVKSFVDSAEAAGLAERVGNAEVKLIPMSGSSVKEEAESGDKDSAEAGTLFQDANTPLKSKPVLSQTWGGEHAQIVLQIHSVSHLSAKDFSLVGQVAQAIETLHSTLNQGEEPDAAEATATE